MNNVFRIYRYEVSDEVDENGCRNVRSYGCNGKEHRIDHLKLVCDKEMTYTTGGIGSYREQQSIGECDHTSCLNLGGFLAQEEKPGDGMFFIEIEEVSDFVDALDIIGQYDVAHEGMISSKTGGGLIKVYGGEDYSICEMAFTMNWKVKEGLNCGHCDETVCGHCDEKICGHERVCGHHCFINK